MRGKDVKSRRGCGERKVWNSRTGWDTWTEETLHVCLLTSPPRNKQNVSAETSRKLGRHLLAFNGSPQTSAAAHTHTLHLLTLGQRYRHASLCLPLKKTLGLVMPHCGVIWMLNVDKCMTLSGSVSECTTKGQDWCFPARTDALGRRRRIVVCPHPNNIQQRNTPFGKCRSGSLSNIRTSDAHGLVCVKKTPTVDYYYTTVGFRNAFTAVVHTALWSYRRGFGFYRLLTL